MKTDPKAEKDAEKALFIYRAAQAAYKRKVATRWAAVGGPARPKPRTTPKPVVR